MDTEPDNQNPAATPPDAGALNRARADLADSATLARKQVEKLFDKIFNVQQLALFEAPEFEEAVLLDPEKLGKTYTAEQAEKIVWRRDACLYMLARECPVEDIAVVLRMNLRTISALAAQNGRALAAFTEEFAQRLLADAASDIAFAHTKRDAASYKDLHVGAGIKLTHAVALKLVGESNTKPPEAIEVESERLSGLRDRIKQLQPAAPEPVKETQP